MGRNKEWGKIDEVLRTYLGNKYHLVGVKIVQDYASKSRLAKPKEKTVLCKMVKDAALRNRVFQTDARDLAASLCPKTMFSLGFKEPKFAKLTWFVEPIKTKSIIVGSVAKLRITPDVVILILNAEQWLHLTTVFPKDLAISPTRIVRSEDMALEEAIATPYMKKAPIALFFCEGAILYAGFEESELVFGASPEVVKEIVKVITEIPEKGILSGCSKNSLPRKIVHDLEKMGLHPSNYYFSGEIREQDIRVYLNHGPSKAWFLSVHSSEKAASKKVDESVAEKILRSNDKIVNIRMKHDRIGISITRRIHKSGLNLRKIVYTTVEEIGRIYNKHST